MSQHDNDIKFLSRKALDILIPQLPFVSESMQVEGAQQSSPKWIQWTYKIFSEENCIISSSLFA